MNTEFELSTTDRFGGLLVHKEQLAKSNEHYREIHPRDAADSDAVIAAEKAKAVAERKARRFMLLVRARVLEEIEFAVLGAAECSLHKLNAAGQAAAGSRAVAPPRSTANRSSEIAPKMILLCHV